MGRHPRRKTRERAVARAFGIERLPVDGDAHPDGMTPRFAIVTKTRTARPAPLTRGLAHAAPGAEGGR